MSSYLSEYDNPPSIVESLTTPPSALHAEEFVGDSYGIRGKKKNTRPEDSTVTKFAEGIQDVLKKETSNKSVRTALRELGVHFLFLVVVCIVAFSTSSSSTFYFTKVMSDLFTTTRGPKNKIFTDVSSMDELWSYTQNQLMDGLYWEPLSTGKRLRSNERAMVFYENRLLGKPRIRMLKVKNDSCIVVQSFSREIKECFSQYTEGKEDRASFHPPEGKGLNAFRYTEGKELENKDLWGVISTYGGGGFVQYLSIDNKEESAKSIEILQNNRWISRGTRLVLIDFALYNGNLNLFCVVKLIFELPATGGVIPTSQFDSMKLIRYVSTYDYVVLACEGIFVAFTIFFILEEIYDIFKWRLGYVKEFWNVVDIIVIGLSIVCIFLSLYRTSLSRTRINKLLEGQLSSSPFDDVVQAENLYVNFTALLLFFAWIKVFKYISFNKTMSQLSATLSRSAKDIGGFAVMFFVFFFAYAQFGYLVFGTQISDYSTFYDAVFALFRTILGDFDFHALETANRVLGPIFFITYVFFVFFVLLNMFLAIINDTYVEVKGELARNSDHFQSATAFSQGWYRFLRVLRLTKDADTIDSNVDFDAWKTALMKNGYTHSQINDKFAKYEVLSWKTMDPMETQRLEEELENERKEREKRAEEHRDVAVVGRRVEQIECAILTISERIERVATAVRKTEIDKVRTRQHTNTLSVQGLNEDTVSLTE